MSRKRKNQAKPPAFLKSLSEPPDGTWPQGALFHGARILLLVFLAAGITLLFPTEGGRSTTGAYQVGDVASEDMMAEIPFQVPKDSAVLAGQREEAAAAVPPVFLYDPGAEARVEAELNAFFDQVVQAGEAGGLTAVQQALRQALGQEDLSSVLENAALFLDPTEVQALRRAILEIVRTYSDRYLESDYADEVVNAGRIQYIQDGQERSRDAAELLWGTDFYRTANEDLPPTLSEYQSVVRILLIHFFHSPYTLDANRTEARRAEARSAVPDTEGSVVQGAVFVRRGDQIGPGELRRLNAYESALQAQGRVTSLGPDWGFVIGSFLLDFMLLGIFGLLLFFFRQEVYRSYRWVLLLTLLISAYFLAAAAISWQSYPWELLPIAFVVLPVAILWDGRMALILALVLGVLSGAQEPFNTYPVLAFTVVGGAAAALSARAVRRRSQTWIFIALITLGYALTIVALGLLGHGPAGGIVVSIVFAGLNATVTAILAMGFMPVFEWFTGITTDQTLLEWADPNRPLLKSLSLEASGTYAHTINVANLAEAAATAIGANGLLARVGIYYHDVGKMLKPQYFVENQPGGRNPHDKLKPQTSAEIVREHVIEGERMAREKGVPDIIARFIPEHHGTQLIGFFYEKAKEESEVEPDPAEFRYPGPKPRSKETAIAMLADSVESATRVLQNPSPDRVRELVQTIVEGKIRDGQLADAPLTLRELSMIQDQFVKVISGMFHHRLDYPATRHVTGDLEAQNKETGQKEPAGEEDGSPGGVPPAKAGGAKPGAGKVSDEQLPLSPAEDPAPSRRGEGEDGGLAPSGQGDPQDGASPAEPKPVGGTNGEG